MATPQGKRRRTGQRLSHDERRAQILKVAAGIFRKRPYSEVSLDEIADAAGVARGLINHHFGSKRDLYVEVVRRTLQSPLLPVPGYVHGATLEQRVDESIDGFLGAVERNPKLWLDTVRSGGIGDAEIAAIIEEFRDGGVRRITEVVGMSFDDLTPEQYAMMRVWEGMAEAAILQWIDAKRLTREQVHRLLVDTVITGVRGFLGEPVAAK